MCLNVVCGHWAVGRPSDKKQVHLVITSIASRALMTRKKAIDMCCTGVRVCVRMRMFEWNQLQKHINHISQILTCVIWNKLHPLCAQMQHDLYLTHDLFSIWSSQMQTRAHKHHGPYSTLVLFPIKGSLPRCILPLWNKYTAVCCPLCRSSLTQWTRRRANSKISLKLAARTPK